MNSYYLRNFIMPLISFISAPSFAQWSVDKELNPVSEVTSYYATSPAIKAIKKQRSPYTKTLSWVGVACDTKGNSWAYLGHTSTNFSGGDWSDSSKIHSNVKFRFDDQVQEFSLKESGDFLHLYSNEDGFINMIKSANSLIAGVEWYKQGAVYFKYSMNGSSKAINSIMKRCGIPQKKRLINNSSSCNDVRENLTTYEVDVQFYQENTIGIDEYKRLTACFKDNI